MTAHRSYTHYYFYAIVLALLMLASSVNAQTEQGKHAIDSLRKVIPQLQGKEKGDALADLFRQYYLTLQVDSALSTLNQLIIIRQQNGDTEGEAAARWNVIALLNNAGKHELLLRYSEEQMEWYRKHQMWDRFYQCWQRKCSANHDMGRIQTALREAEEMLEFATKHDNNIGRAMAYKQMGITYYDIHQFNEAAKALEQSISLLRNENDMTGMQSGVYEALCQSYDRLHRYDEAFNLTFQWEEHLHSLEKEHTLAIISPTLVSCYTARTKAYIRLKKFDEAHKALAQAIEYQKMGQSLLTKYYILEMQADLALNEGFVGQAIAFADSTLATGVYVDENIHELRAEALFLAGRGIEAAKEYRGLYERKDSLFNRDMRTQLDELNTIFKIDELNRKQQRTRMYFIIVIGVIILAGLLFFILYRLHETKLLKQKNKELTIANARAEESLTIKSEFIKTISHEIRTPLNVLSGFTQIITSPDIDLSEKETKNIHQLISDNTKRITQLINKMLELSDASSQTVITRDDVVSPHDIVEQTIKLTGITTYSQTVNFTLQEQLTDSNLNIHTNRQAVVRALEQLLDNAKKFTHEGNITLKVTNDAHTLHFIVEDTGIGIPEGESERIFEEFTQLNKYTEGTGIGLTVARSIARRLGGDIVLDTSYKCQKAMDKEQEGTGARFIMTLPIS